MISLRLMTCRLGRSRGYGVALTLVRDLRAHRVPASAEDLAGFETDVLAGFVLARASAGLADSTIRNDTGHLELIRDWFGRPLREMQAADADAYFGKVLRHAKPSTRTGRAAALTVYFQFLPAAQDRDLQPHQPRDRVPAG
jgi:integrase/recombinase XerD